MKIYTKTGDKGSTSLYDCSRVSKSSSLIKLLGDIDELNSFIGIIESSKLLGDIQVWLFDMGTIIANPSEKKKYNFDINLEFTKILEKEIDEKNKSFINFKGVITNAVQLNEEYNKAHIILIVSVREGLPMVIMEGMALGVVPICTNVGALSEIISNSVNGISKPPE